MSADAKYIIQLDCPADSEIQAIIQALKPYDFKIWGYDTLQGDTKHFPDEEIIKAAGKYSGVQVIRCIDQGLWEEIWSFNQSKK
jgi:hypothetical protein